MAQAGTGTIWRTELLRLAPPILILALAVIIYRGSSLFKAPPPLAEEEAVVPQVLTADIRSFEGPFTLTVDGTVVPYREVLLAAEVAGRVQMRSEQARAGRFVTRGTLLCAIDPQDYQLQVEQLQAEIRQAELQVEQVQVDLTNNQELVVLSRQDVELQAREVQRLRRLQQTGNVTESDLDRALQAELASRNQLQSLENRKRFLQAQQRLLQQSIESLRKRLAQAELNLSRTRVVAPLDGVIVESFVEQDNFVQRGSPLFRIEDTSAAEVSCRLPRDAWTWIWKDTRAPEPKELQSDAHDPSKYELPPIPAEVVFRVEDAEYIWSGQLARYEGLGLDPRTRTAACRILVPNPRRVERRQTASATSLDPNWSRPPALLRGMYVSVELKILPRQRLAVVPLEALQLGDVLWRVVDQRLKITPVRVLKRLPSQVLLEQTSSFTIGDQVVVSPLALPQDGMRVVLAPSGPDAAASDTAVGSARQTQPAQEEVRPSSDHASVPELSRSVSLGP